MNAVGWICLGWFVAVVLAVTVAGLGLGPARVKRVLGGRLGAALAGSLLVAAVVGIYFADKAEQDNGVIWEASPPAWWRLPLGVSWSDRDLGGPAGTVADAIERFNDEAGCRIFVAAPVAAADVRIVGADGMPCGQLETRDERAVLEPWVGAARFRCGGRVEIQVRQLEDVRTAETIIRHELGHALGLEHTRWGLMAKTPGDPMVPGATSLNDRQLRAVRALFCSRSRDAGRDGR